MALDSIGNEAGRPCYREETDRLFLLAGMK
jgi:hypothetical protein